MPIRRFRRSFSRRPRRKTRWFAITPAGFAGGASGTTVASEIFMEDESGNVPLARLVGSTILTVIVEAQASLTLGVPPPASGQYNSHWGIFTDQAHNAGSVDGTTWDPNKPFGDFMLRDTMSLSYNDITGTGPIVSEKNGRNMSMRTRVKRVVREGTHLFIVEKNFISGGITGVDYGYTGRVLIALS